MVRSTGNKGRRKTAASQPAEEQPDIIDGVAEDVVEEETTTVPETDPLNRATWQFDQVEAEQYYLDAKEAAANYARAEQNLPVRTRQFAAACYDLVHVLMPDIEGLRRALPRDQLAIEGGSILPEPVIEFLIAHDIQPPHFRSTNPFHGLVQTLYVQGRQSTKNTLTAAQAASLIANANAPDTGDDQEISDEERKRRKAADATQQSKIARWVLSAVDMADRDLIIKNSQAVALTKWQDWQGEGGVGKTLAVVKARTGRKSKADREREAAAKAEREEQLRQAEASRKRIEQANQPETEDEPVDWMTGEGDSDDEPTGPLIEGVVETEDDLPPVEEPEAPVAAPEAVEPAQPATELEAPEPPPAPEPEVRFHAFSEPVPIILTEDVLEGLPERGKLVFLRRTAGLVLIGWEG